MELEVRKKLYHVDGKYTEQQIEIFKQYYLSGLNITQIAKYHKLPKKDVVDCLVDNVELKRVFQESNLEVMRRKHEEEANGKVLN